MEFFVVILVVAVVVFAIFTAQARESRIESNFQRLANRFDGRVEEGGLFTNLTLHLRPGGVDAFVTYRHGSKNSPPRTRIMFDWSRDTWMRIAPEGIFAGLSKIFGAQDIQVGDPGFDSRFLIQGDPPEFVRSFLDEDVRGRIYELSELGAGFFEGSGVSLDLNPTGFSIQISRDLFAQEGELDAFVDHAVALLERLRQVAGDGGVEGVPLAGAPKGSVCLVCRSELTGDVVGCPRCKTPHHRQCWEYYGTCAVFSCSRG